MNTIVELEAGAIAAVSKVPPDEARIKRITDAFLALANSFEIKTQEDYTLASEELRKIISRHSDWDVERKTFTDPLREVLDRLNAKYMPYLKVLRGDGKKDTVHAEGILKSKMTAFLEDQERLRVEEQRKAEALAQAERDRLAAEAERVRKEAEAAAEVTRKAEEARQAAARAEAARLEADAAAARGKKAKAEAEERARVAREAEAVRQAEADRVAAEQREQAERAAQALETTAAVTIAQPVTVVVQKGRGISTPKKWVGEVTDKLALMAFIIEKRPDLVVLFDVNNAALNAQVKLMGAGTSVPGITIKEQTSITVR